MARINFEVTDEEKRLIKAQAALSGESLRVFILKHILPADRIYNATTLEAIEEVENEGEGIRYYESAEDMFQQLHRPAEHPDDSAGD